MLLEETNSNSLICIESTLLAFVSLVHRMVKRLSMASPCHDPYFTRPKGKSHIGRLRASFHYGFFVQNTVNNIFGALFNRSASVNHSTGSARPCHRHWHCRSLLFTSLSSLDSVLPPSDLQAAENYLEVFCS